MTALLVLVTEAVVFTHRHEIEKDFWNRFVLNEASFMERVPSHPYLLVGNSQQKTGILPPAVDEGLLNIGLSGAKPMAHYILLNRYLEKHDAPKTVFIYVDPERQGDLFYMSLRYFFSFREFLSVFGDLDWEERKVFLHRYFATLDYRKSSIGRREDYPGTNNEYLARMILNKGFMPTPPYPIEITSDYFSKNPRRVEDHIYFKERDRAYMRRIFDLADRRGFEVVLLPMILPEELAAFLTATGFSDEYIRLLDELGEGRPNVRVPEKKILVLSHDHFEDSDHVNEKGAEAYTRYFTEYFFIPARERARVG